MILAEIEAENFLEKEGFPVARKAMIANKPQLLTAVQNFGFPCVLKISSSTETHKAKIGGVKVLYSHDDIEKNWDGFEKTAKKFDGKIMLQKFESGKELLVGLKKDPVFGHVLLLGIGGGYTEIIKDINFKILHRKIGANELMEMIKQLKNFKMIENCSLNSIVNVLFRTASLVEKFQNIRELDINPLIVNENRAVVVDARMIRD